MNQIIDYRKFCHDQKLEMNLDVQIITEVTGLNDKERYVCLTFDDGPSIEYTPQILDILREHNVHATFFVLGEFVSYFPEVARRIIEEGHEIANHTFSHPELHNLSQSELLSELLRTETEIASVIENEKCKLFRPTYGVFSADTVENVRKLGYKFVLWSRTMLVKDWELPGVDIMVNTITRHLKNGAIILLHDGGGNRDQTVQTIREVIPVILKKGYSIITVSELLNLSTTKGNSSE
ncbi:polysaccharide deacetylase family protein [Paenibacillus pinisoli]|uniref:Polysaccharide deacetylase family protein n=1 Tax=Paenibacillus pinisoli TaxID=1276110 RepID=A0A3A6PUF6_9BACL|nr:polysaccharide deacetylase family protein [Paenibacillus pinisoli]RJX37534.1 polysaccharide deacetylase family protein [Paenibacillus pinisoli]